MFIGGNSEKLAEIARNEKVLDLKVTAIRNLGLLGGGRSGDLLLSLYNTDGRYEVRKGVIEALFIQGNAKTLVNLASRGKCGTDTLVCAFAIAQLGNLARASHAQTRVSVLHEANISQRHCKQSAKQQQASPTENVRVI